MTQPTAVSRPRISLQTIGIILLFFITGGFLWVYINGNTNSEPSVIDNLLPQPTVEVSTNNNFPIITSGLNVLFQDNFDNADERWQLSSASQALYQGGALVLNDTGHADIGWARPHLRFSDMILNVNSKWISGSVGGSYGVRVRYADEGNFYGITIRNDGWYAIGRQHSGILQIIQEDFTNAIERNGGINTIHIEANGNHLRFFVNNIYLADITDETIAPYGDIMFTSFKAEGTERFEVGFDNLIVTQFPQSE